MKQARIQDDADVLESYHNVNESFSGDNFTFSNPPQSEVELISIFSCMIN